MTGEAGSLRVSLQNGAITVLGTKGLDARCGQLDLDAPGEPHFVGVVVAIEDADRVRSRLKSQGIPFCRAGDAIQIRPKDAFGAMLEFTVCAQSGCERAREEGMTSVLDGYQVDPEVSLLDKTRMQAQVLVPVLRALRLELGTDKANAIVRRALRDWSKQLFAAIADGIEGTPRRKWATMQSAWNEVSARDVEFEVLRHDKEALDIDVTRCRFAEFYRALGEPELGSLLICDTDFDVASAGKGEVSLDRAQTIMRGAPSCTFRYKFTPR